VFFQTIVFLANNANESLFYSNDALPTQQLSQHY